MRERNGLDMAIDLALKLKKLAAIARAAAIAGIKGALIQAAKEFSPTIIKIVVVTLSVLLLIPFLIVSALPNFLFRFDKSTSTDVMAMTDKAKVIEAAYKSTKDYNKKQVDEMLKNMSENYDDVQVLEDTDNLNHYWFIAICSVAYKQDLFAMNEEDIKSKSIINYIFHTSEEEYTSGEGENIKKLKRLKVTVKDLNPEELMTQLNFTAEEKNWAKAIYRTMTDDQTIRPGDPDYVAGNLPNYGDIKYKNGETNVVYYNQGDDRWGNKLYGKTDTIRVAACGPTSLAMVVSSLSNRTILPDEMANWAVENGYRVEGSGSSHALIPDGAKSFGLSVEGITRYEGQKIVDALASGKLVVAIMGPGNFTTEGHFIVLRGVTSDGKILVADPASRKRSDQEWDLNIILNESRKGAGAGGPFWAVGL